MAENLPDSDKITGNDPDKDEAKNAAAIRGARSKICQVCGDKALGYNFNAITCESCKAFFRRNALNKKEFTCPFNQNCDITVVTRRFCQKCRLTKCFSIGMKKEYIMSEADKAAKRQKIELNRAKRQLNGGEAPQSGNSSDVDSPALSHGKRIKNEDSQNEETSWSMVEEPNCNNATLQQGVSECRPCSSNGYESCSPSGVDPTFSNGAYTAGIEGQQPESLPTISTSVTTVPELAPSEIVNRIICVPEKSSQSINQLMPTQQDALKMMSRVINSPTDALRLVDHFIAQPGDALTIISKIMNSALDALSVFIQFMSSPTDALQIINKIINTPGEVLQFIQQLMINPQDALDIMTKFMNEPAEALKMINRMINNEESPLSEADSSAQSEHEMLRKSVEGNLIKSIINTNTMEVGPALEGPPPSATTFNPFSSYTHISYPSTSNPCNEQLGLSSVSGIPQSSPDCDARDGRESPRDGGVNSVSEDRTRDILEEVENKPLEPYTIESIICEAIKVEYASCSSSTKSRELNDAERAKLNELIVANKALYAPVDEDWANLINDSARLKVSNSLTITVTPTPSISISITTIDHTHTHFSPSAV